MTQQFHSYIYTPQRMENGYSNSFARMSMAALFMIVKKWKRPKCPPMGKGINRIGYILEEDIIQHKKESSVDTCYNVDEPQKHYAK